MTSPSDDTSPLIGQILMLLAQVSTKLEPGAGEMKEWIAEYFSNPELTDMLHDITVMSVRVLDTIGRLEPVNGITISRESRIPKGSVSKITRRLIAQKLISQEPLPNNKKEVLFRLTPLGRELSEANQAFDAEMKRRFVAFLERYSDDELHLMVRVLQDFMESSVLQREALQDD